MQPFLALFKHKFILYPTIIVIVSISGWIAMQIIRDEIEKHPLSIDIRTAKEKSQKKERTRVCVLSLNDWSVTLRAWIWAKTPAEVFSLRCDLLKTLKEQFQAQGIEIPLPHQTLQLQSDARESST